MQADLCLIARRGHPALRRGEVPLRAVADPTPLRVGALAGTRVLVASANAAFADFLCATLQEAALRAEAACSGVAVEQALARAADGSDPFAFLLMDADLPEPGVRRDSPRLV